MANGLADPSPDPVARNGLAQRAGRGESDPRAQRLRVADEERREQGTGVLDAGVVNPAKVLGAQQTDTFRKTCDTALPLFGADGEFFAAPGAAAGQNGATVLRLHPGAEPVRLRAMAVVRLKGTFRHDDYKEPVYQDFSRVSQGMNQALAVGGSRFARTTRTTSSFRNGFRSRGTFMPRSRRTTASEYPDMKTILALG
jgi:hypothetical protein